MKSGLPALSPTSPRWTRACARREAQGLLQGPARPAAATVSHHPSRRCQGHWARPGAPEAALSPLISCFGLFERPGVGTCGDRGPKNRVSKV